jgi:hypothetical protein
VHFLCHVLNSNTRVCISVLYCTVLYIDSFIHSIHSFIHSSISAFAVFKRRVESSRVSRVNSSESSQSIVTTRDSTQSNTVQYSLCELLIRTRAFFGTLTPTEPNMARAWHDDGLQFVLQYSQYRTRVLVQKLYMDSSIQIAFLLSWVIRVHSYKYCTSTIVTVTLLEQ